MQLKNKGVMQVHLTRRKSQVISLHELCAGVKYIAEVRCAIDANRVRKERKKEKKKTLVDNNTTMRLVVMVKATTGGKMKKYTVSFEIPRET